MQNGQKVENMLKLETTNIVPSPFRPTTYTSMQMPKPTAFLIIWHFGKLLLNFNICMYTYIYFLVIVILLDKSYEKLISNTHFTQATCERERTFFTYRVRRENFYTFISVDCNKSVNFLPHQVAMFVYYFGSITVYFYNW